MKVLIVEPGKYPREAAIEHTLEAEQAVVGGTIEAVYPWRDSACIVGQKTQNRKNLKNYQKILFIGLQMWIIEA